MRERRKGATINAARHASLLISNQVRTFENVAGDAIRVVGALQNGRHGFAIEPSARNSHSKHSRSCGVFAFTLGVAPRAQLQSQPLCEFCLKKNCAIAANVADHVEPHRGDPKKLFEGKLQSLCFVCHDIAKRQEETQGYRAEIGCDGWPVDANHPVYGRK
jgi:5-methylcytosine-specific restriction protein A